MRDPSSISAVHDRLAQLLFTNKLIFRQAPILGNLFTSQAEALSSNPDSLSPETEAKFSLLDQFESFRSSDGVFRLRLVYPSNNNRTIEFEQTSNPFTSPVEGAVSGLNILSGSDGAFQGLALSSVGTALLDGTRGSNWWWALGSFGIFNGGTVPSSLNPQTTSTDVELYVTKT